MKLLSIVLVIFIGVFMINCNPLAFISGIKILDVRACVATETISLVIDFPASEKEVNLITSEERLQKYIKGDLFNAEDIDIVIKLVPDKKIVVLSFYDEHSGDILKFEITKSYKKALDFIQSTPDLNDYFSKEFNHYVIENTKITISIK